MANKFKTLVLNYLLEHKNEDISRTLLAQECGISTSRLSEVLKDIKSDGYIIESPNRSGIVKLVLDEVSTVLPEINDLITRQWLILFMLSIPSKKSLSFEEIKAKIAAFTFDEASMPDSTIHSDLSNLASKQLVAFDALSKKYSITDNAPALFPLSEDEMDDFISSYEVVPTMTSEIEPLKSVYKLSKTLFCPDDADLVRLCFGRSNNISKQQIDEFDKFIEYPYKTNALSIRTNNGGHQTFYVGLLFYSQETNQFYALGQAFSASGEFIIVKPLSKIDVVSVLPNENTKYHTQHFKKIYEEMFETEYTELYDVKVLFDDHARERFKRLSNNRPSSSIEKNDDASTKENHPYIYTDKLRGIDDFARFIRSFGRSVIVLEPEHLRSKIIESLDKTIALYEVDKNE